MRPVKIISSKSDVREIDRIADILRDGGAIIYPTDTIYAIGCDALNVRAVERICRLKGINPQKADLSIICYDLSNISGYAKVNNNYFKLMKRNLPGAFTFILPTSSNLPKIYKNRKTVGIRVPVNNINTFSGKSLRNPILTTSVPYDEMNPEYTTDPELIAERYDKDIDLVIDGGYGGNIPSTTIDCTGEEAVILRREKENWKNKITSVKIIPNNTT